MVGMEKMVAHTLPHTPSTATHLAPNSGHCLPSSQGGAIRCLQDARQELSHECRATLFDHEVRAAEDVDFNFPLRSACTTEISELCKGVQQGQALILRWVSREDGTGCGRMCRPHAEHVTMLHLRVSFHVGACKTTWGLTGWALSARQRLKGIYAYLPRTTVSTSAWRKPATGVCVWVCVVPIHVFFLSSFRVFCRSF